jgi:hypothetical protein
MRRMTHLILAAVVAAVIGVSAGSPATTANQPQTEKQHA